MGNTTLQRDRLVGCLSRRNADLIGAVSLAVLDRSVDRLRALTLLTPATGVGRLSAKKTWNLKFLYGSNLLFVDREFGCCQSDLLLLGQYLSGHLLDLQDHKLSRLERRKANHYVDDPKVYVVLRRALVVALDEVGIPRRGSLEGPLAEEVAHEGARR